MRYLVQFADKTSMTVSEQEGIAIGKALASGNAIVLHGAFINSRFISIVKPIKKGFFKEDYIEQQNRLELESPLAVKFISAPPNEHS